MSIFTQPEDVENLSLVMAYSDAVNNDSAIREIDNWAYANKFIRSNEYHLGRKQTADGKMLFFSPCYRLDEDIRRAADTDLARIRERRERMPMTTSSDVLLREEN